MNNKYNSFFFLHIDKTIGPVTGIHMFDPIYKILEHNGIAANINLNHSNHNKWTDCSDDTFILCIIRDPLYRTVADFCYTALYDENGYRFVNEWRDRFTEQLNKEKFIDWFNSKFIANYHYNIISNFNSDNFEKNFNRINLLIKSSSIKGNENLIQDRILEKFNIKNILPKYNSDMDSEFMQELANHFIAQYLDQEIVQLIYNANNLDLNLYNSISF